MSPVLLNIVWQHPGDLELEQHLHHVFIDHCLWGEWFVFENDPIPAIKQEVENYLGKLEDPKPLDSEDPFNL